jgi:hypothetical protein
MRTQIERARARHNELVDELTRLNRRLDKLDEQRMRAVSKKKKLISSVGRSSKRIDKLVAVATHTNGPTATVAPPLVQAVKEKKTQAILDDPVPAFKPKRKGRRTPDDLRAELDARKNDGPTPIA